MDTQVEQAVEQTVGQEVAPETVAAPNPFDDPQFKKMLQSESDKKVAPLAMENKRIRDELEALKKQSMTEAERMKYEAAQERARLAEELAAKEQNLARYITRAEINKRGWTEDLAEFVQSNDEDQVRVRADKLQAMIDAQVQSQLKKHLASTGLPPSSTNVSTTAPEQIDRSDPRALYRAVQAGKITLK